MGNQCIRSILLVLCLWFAWFSGGGASSLIGQTSFTQAKLRFKRYQGGKFLQQIHLYTADEKSRVHLRYRACLPQGEGKWDIIGGVGGNIRVITWKRDTLCIRSQQGQLAATVYSHPDSATVWRIVTAFKDTFVVRLTHDAGVSYCLLSQLLHLPDQQAVEVPLLAFSKAFDSRKWMIIEKQQGLTDISDQVRILAILLAAIHLFT